jgi:redox-sensing transcriptional repressor
VVRDIADLEQIVREERIAIAVLATPASVAQDVCDSLVEAGVTSILNFAPVVLSVPDHVDVRKVDLAAELQILSFHETRKAAQAVINQ